MKIKMQSVVSVSARRCSAHLALTTFLWFLFIVASTSIPNTALAQTQSCGGSGQSACAPPAPTQCTIGGASSICLPLQKGNWQYDASPGEPYGPIFGGFYSSLAGFDAGLANAYDTQFAVGLGICSPAVTGLGAQFAPFYYLWGVENGYYQWIYLHLWSNNGYGVCQAPNPDPTPGKVRVTRQVSCPANFSAAQDSAGNWTCACAAGAECSVPRPSKGGLTKGDPSDVALGNMREVATDYSAPSGSPLRFTRTYNSLIGFQHYNGKDSPGWDWPFGIAWGATYFQFIEYTSASDSAHTGAYVHRPDGSVLAFNESSGKFSFGGEIADTLSWTYDTHGNQTGWLYTTANADQETYNLAGQLLSITSPAGAIQTLSYNSFGYLASVSDAFGHSLAFNWDSAAHPKVLSITDPSGAAISFKYDSNINLSTVTYADTKFVQYLYELTGSNQINLMTGLIDESGTRYKTWAYSFMPSGAYGPSSSQLASGTASYTFTYNSDGSRTVVDPLGTNRIYTTALVGAQRRYTGVNTACVACGESKSLAYDANGNVAWQTDFNGNETQFINDLTRNLETSRTEAYGTTLARTTTTTWNTTFSLPVLITEPNRTTAVTYDSFGNVLTKTFTDTSVTPNVARTWTYTYDTYGRTLTADGPRTDVTDKTAYAYYTCTTGFQCGQIQTLTDALGHITTFNTYNAHGQPLTVTDPNGVVTTLTYDLRQRLTSRQIGSETTSYSYYPTGLLQTVTLSDSSAISYTYDGAHRLTDISDGLGDHIHYTLDAMGNRTAENLYDPSSTLKRTHTRVINTLNELYQDINSAGTAAVTTTLTYDSNGNVLTSAAPLARNTANQYDALNRLKQITDPNAGITKLSYDANDNLASVIDPRSLPTTYTHDGFGEVTKLVSPDTGTTSSTYDSGGNLKTTTDARSAVATYSYDALNRVTQVAYSDQTINFSFDAGTNGIGRLTGAADANHSMSWTYDGLGRVTGKGQTIGTLTKSVGYAYTNGDRTSLITPSGQTVTYGYTNHRITSVSVNGTTILSGATYDPFGPANAWTWGNATTVSRTFDEDGNPAHIVTAAVTNTYTIDNASRITGISDSGLASNSWTFGYDLLDRVNAGTSTATTRGYTYDASSNRLTTTGTVPSAETIATTSNRLSSTTGSPARTYAYDAAGNTASYASNAYTFNKRGRMSEVLVGANETDYIYNALGQLIKKSGVGGTTLLLYDEAGHILGEYTSAGALIQETVWMGDTPVATLRPNGSTGCTSTVCMFYVHSNHLSTPRKVTRPSDNALMWRWDPDTFGSVAPNQNPGGVGIYIYNLRFPGQYVLPESGLYYNYFRTYDPSMGRYIESDPIGLSGGINTYAFVGGNPLSFIDPFGLTQCDIDVAYEIAQQLNPDLNFGEGPPKPDLPRNGGRAGYNSLKNQGNFKNIPGRDGLIHLDSKYLDQLDPASALDLLDTIIHEALHGTRPPEIQVPPTFDHDYIVPEAAKRTAADKKKYMGQRKVCGCEGAGK